MANPPANPNQTPPAEPIDETPTPPNPHPIGTPEYEGFAKALAEIQQRRTEPAPPTSDDHRLAQAFVWAITSYVFLDRGEPDRMLRLGGKELSIGEIAAAASQLDGSMPDDVYALLSNAAYRDAPRRSMRCACCPGTATTL